MFNSIQFRAAQQNNRKNKGNLLITAQNHRKRIKIIISKYKSLGKPPIRCARINKINRKSIGPQEKCPTQQRLNYVIVLKLYKLQTQLCNHRTPFPHSLCLGNNILGIITAMQLVLFKVGSLLQHLFYIVKTIIFSMNCSRGQTRSVKFDEDCEHC